MNTAELIALWTCIATWIYVVEMLGYLVLVFMTLYYIGDQVEVQRQQMINQVINQEEERRFQELMAIFKDLQTQELFDQIKYICERFPEDIEGIDSSQLIIHIQKAEIALAAFNRIGYLTYKSHIDAISMLENHWSSIWRCWKKSKNLINWAREQQGEPTYLKYFENLFGFSEMYRLQMERQEPKIYTVSRIIT